VMSTQYAAPYSNRDKPWISGVGLMLLVRDVMRRQVYGIAANDAIVDAAREMVLRSVDSLLVVDGDLLLGIVTERDVLRAALPSVGELMQDESWTELRDLVGVASGHFGVPVRMIMTIHVATTTPETPLTQALASMMAKGFRRLPVVEPETGVVLGTISQRDVLGALVLADRAAASRQNARIVAAS
jgi:CBS domain-containing protein